MHELCEDGFLSPPQCQTSSNSCALMVSDYPSMYLLLILNMSNNLFITENISTSTLYNQILADNLLVQVAFVGPHLSTVIDILNKVNDRSFLVLHYNPSILTIKHSLVPIIFPDCKDPLLQRDPSDAKCLYTSSPIDSQKLFGILFRMERLSFSNSFSILGSLSVNTKSS